MSHSHLFDLKSKPVELLLKQMAMSPHLLQKKVAIVTGAARGIGKHTAHGLAHLGARVVIADMRSEGKYVAESINKNGGSAVFVLADLADQEQVHTVSKTASDTFGPVDILVNNAVHFEIYSLLEMSMENWDRTLSTNVRASLLLTRLVLPHMLQKKEGIILNMIALEGMAYAADMSASKVALRSLTISLAEEIGIDSGVKVLGFAPGLVATPLVADVFPQYTQRLGIDFEDYVQNKIHNPGYPGLMPTEHAGAGVVHAIIHASEHHGLIADPYQPLEQAGIISFENPIEKEKPAGQSTNETRLHDYITEVTNLNKNIEEKIKIRTQELQEERDLTKKLLLELKTRTTELEKTNQKLQSEVNERKQIQKALRTAKETAEEATRTKSEFLANMSHEIRTPLNAIIGLTSLLLDSSLSTEQLDFVQTVRNSGDGLLTIINDILDFSKIEAEKLELDYHPLDLYDCIEESIDLIAMQADQKGLEIIHYFEPDVPQHLYGDATRLRQIVVNLLSNAVKFTEKGEIVLWVKNLGDDDGRVNLQFSVRDSGIGISPKQVSRLFKPFSQVDPSTTRKFGGTGLGLIISRRLAEAMEGDMWVESKVGEGSTFYFTIAANPISDRKGDSHLNLQSHKDKTILIVDDNKTNRLILYRQLTDLGFKARAAPSAIEALSWLKTGQKYDLALLDLQMPDLDGISLTKEIKQLGRCHSMPIALLTSIHLNDSTADLKVAGIDAKLTKPIKYSQLCEVVFSLLDLRRPNDGQTRRVYNDDSNQETVRLAQTYPLRILVAEDNTVNQKVALKMLERLGYRADVVSNGIEVISALHRQPYDIILMDVQMPEMDGVEATKIINNQWCANKKPRIIALTANALKGDREKYIRQGMDDYLSKPMRLPDLEVVLERAAKSDKD